MIVITNSGANPLTIYDTWLNQNRILTTGQTGVVEDSFYEYLKQLQALGQVSLTVDATSQLGWGGGASAVTVAALVTLSGVATDAANLGAFSWTIIPDNVTVKSALQALETELDTLDQSIVLKWVWDASAGTFPGAGAAQAGWKYIVSVAGTVDSVDFEAGDTITAIVDNASTTTFAANWLQLDNTEWIVTGPASWRPPVDMKGAELDAGTNIVGTVSYSLDGVPLTNGMRILLTGEATAPATYLNKVFLVGGVGTAITLTLETDGYLGTGSPNEGDRLYVKSGTTNGNQDYNYDGSAWNILSADLPYVFSFNATTDWGAASGGLYTQTITAATHGFGTDVNNVVVYETVGGTSVLVNVNEVIINNTTGDVSFNVPDSPDGRFIGKVVIIKWQSVGSSWSGTVTSVNTYTGAVTLVKGDIGLGNVDNTSNATERAATATLTNKTIDLGSNTVTTTLAQLNTAVSDADVATLAGTETLTNKTLTSPTINSAAMTSPTGIVKADVGLWNVDNTSDSTKNSATATLTNKTIDLANNTVSGTTAQFNTALSDGDFATLAGTETLTNKTLTTPAISSPTGLVKADVGLGNVDNTSNTTERAATATLTNKTIDLGSNTVTTTLAQLNTAVSDADVADDSLVVHLAGAETVTGVKTFSADPIIPDEAYGVGWDGSLEPATKNALYDKIETLSGGGITASSTDTLTNKTVNLSSNTLSGTTAQFNTALSDGDFATLAGTETLTNKTLTTPAISSPTGLVKADVGLGNVDNTSNATERAATATLTNKTIDLGSNTVTTTLAQLNTAVSDADVASLAGAETLTNKTLGDTLTLAENAEILLDPALSADGTWNGISRAGTAGTTLAFGDLCYLDPTDSRWELADANAVANTDGDARGILGICILAAAADGSATKMLLHGIVRADAAFPAMTINAQMYVSETAWDITGTQPVTTDAVIRVVGSALTADELYFAPSYDYITHT